jgi:hypothetical protein
MDITSIAALVGSLKAATDIAKFIRESDASLEKAEMKLKLAELISAIADAKVEASQVQQELLDRDERIRALEAKLVLKAEVQWEKPFYWRLQQGGSKDGPYCQRCYDVEAKLHRLQGSGEGYWECKACKSEYTDDSYAPTITSVGFPNPGRYEGY